MLMEDSPSKSNPPSQSMNDSINIDIEPPNPLRTLKNQLNLLVQSHSPIPDPSSIKVQVYDAIYGSLSSKQVTKSEIQEILVLLKQIFLASDEDTKNLILRLMEELFFIFIFHFDFEINHFGFVLLKFLLEITTYDYHKEMLMNVIKLIQILNIKRSGPSASTSIANVILSNCASALSLIVRTSSNDTKKILFDFVKKNYSEYNLIYLLLIGCDGEFNFSKMFSNEQIYDILDRYKSELDKNYKNLDSYLSSKTFDGTLSAKSQVRQIVEKISAICKIIDTFTNRGHRTYSIDKIVKNLIPIGRKLIGLLMLKVNESDFDLPPEAVSNIIGFLQAINCLDTENVLLILNWNQIFLRGDKKYIGNTEQIVENLINCEITDQTFAPSAEKKENVCQVVIQIIENILTAYESEKDDIVISFNIYKMYASVLKLNSKVKIDSNLYSKTFEFINSNKEIFNSFEQGNFEYACRIYDNAMSNNGEKKYDKKYLMDCISKFEQFKNSMKVCYNLQDASLPIEDKIIKFKTQIDNSTIKIEDFEAFMLDSSIEMYTEIFQQAK